MLQCLIFVLFSESIEDADHPDSGSHYLHPSLLSTNSQQAVGSIEVKNLITTFNRDSFLVVIIVNDFRFIKIWMQKGLNKIFIMKLQLVVFSHLS